MWKNDYLLRFLNCEPIMKNILRFRLGIRKSDFFFFLLIRDQFVLHKNDHSIISEKVLYHFIYIKLIKKL